MGLIKTMCSMMKGGKSCSIKGDSKSNMSCSSKSTCSTQKNSTK